MVGDRWPLAPCRHATPADDVRAIALALPEATERPAWDMACLRVRDEVVASMPPAEEWVAIRLAPGENAELAAERPAGRGQLRR